MSYTKTGDFVLVNKSHIGAKYTGHGVTIAINADYGKPERERTHYRLAIRILANVLDELAWKVGDFVEFHEGKGASAGKLLLVPSTNPSVGYKLSGASTGGEKELERKLKNGEAVNAYTAFNVERLQFHTHPFESMKATGCKYRAFNNELLIDMPEWIKPTFSEKAVTQSQSKRKGKS